ncbi:DUF2279 domain-containing protein [Olleya sp. YS]|uniref:DUF2279 domain-containing protein n=1 Tax=Olleya sp. YS TaxID=3028318 RepID=UPI00243448C4|nr:DUF2279 domain-containing protein [Olleya sp. YS]WGD34817.1 DUF2279 domain-containing protein [Olleya sp. YS]
MKYISYLFLFFFSVVTVAQTDTTSFFAPSDTLNIKRRSAVIITETGLASIALIGLDQLWYADFERSKFHTINDNSEWFQMDKLGHTFTAYQLGRFGAQTLEWSGVSQQNQLVFGATLGFTFLTAVEILDGFSKEWGFSWGDFAANAAGAGLYVGQDLLWDEQRIQLKYSFNRSPYAKQNPKKLGEGLLEEVIKDYNGQTYWLSANVHSFFKDSNVPKWLNIAVGYGVDGLLYGTNDLQSVHFPNQQRRQQFYLSLDADLTKIKTKSTFLKQFFNIINVIKVPFPTLEISGNGKLTGHFIYF